MKWKKIEKNERNEIKVRKIPCTKIFAYKFISQEQKKKKQVEERKKK